MIGRAKRNIAILASVGAMSASVLLIIFFGAWAVSASDNGGVTDLLSGATAGFTGSVAAGNPNANTDADADTAPRLATARNGDGNRGPAATWWGKALLGACPLH